ncbi:Hypothetical predicted protein [Olea europaea subsp. europaea]|uniref:Uncharacterized protein n=1 Tax=Olea europaea subsp. europaea TaxID=158383 RepID=A0A8S0UPM2_OLEEU|nr:Hypothetical predicted protein [Olea europaea subsp. europaea]
MQTIHLGHLGGPLARGQRASWRAVEPRSDLANLKVRLPTPIEGSEPAIGFQETRSRARSTCWPPEIRISSGKTIDCPSSARNPSPARPSPARPHNQAPAGPSGPHAAHRKESRRPASQLGRVLERKQNKHLPFHFGGPACVGSERFKFEAETETETANCTGERARCVELAPRREFKFGAKRAALGADRILRLIDFEFDFPAPASCKRASFEWNFWQKFAPGRARNASFGFTRTANGERRPGSRN